MEVDALEPCSAEAAPAAARRSLREKSRLYLLSFPAVCLALLAIVILVISAKDIGEPDVWWHLQNARHLLTTHSFPAIDTYSFTAAGSPGLRPARGLPPILQHAEWKTLYSDNTAVLLNDLGSVRYSRRHPGAISCEADLRWVWL